MDCVQTPAPELRPLTVADRAAIQAWPPYGPEFRDLDYALRQQGWLDEFFHEPRARLLAAYLGQELAAFTLLATTSPGEAEFRIALRPDLTGRGLGRPIAAATLARGFGEMGLSRIHLVVRQNNPRAIRLYEGLGFLPRGERQLTVNGRETAFRVMDITPDKLSPA